MAFIHKSAGASEGCSLSYAELADLAQRAKRDAVAAIEFARLPDAEKRLAGLLVKSFKPKKAKKPKKGKDLSAREQQHWRNETVRADLFRLRNSRDALMAAALDSPDPAERETARRVLNEG